MTAIETTMRPDEKRDEILALLNMMGFAFASAESVGAAKAASHIEAARNALLTELTDGMSGIVSRDGLARLAGTRAGHC